MGRRRKPTRSKKQLEQSNSRWRWVAVGGVVIAGLIGLGYLLFQDLQGPAPIAPIEDLVEHEHQERDHVDEEIAAGDLPPVGGRHSPVWQNCGIYDEPVSIENATHSLEHGAMWLAYQPDLPEGDVETLRDLGPWRRVCDHEPLSGLKKPRGSDRLGSAAGTGFSGR